MTWAVLPLWWRQTLTLKLASKKSPSATCPHYLRELQRGVVGPKGMRLLSSAVRFRPRVYRSSFLLCRPAYQELEPTGETAAAVVAEPLEGPAEDAVSSTEEPAADLLQRFFNVRDNARRR